MCRSPGSHIEISQSNTHYRAAGFAPSAATSPLRHVDAEKNREVAPFMCALSRAGG
jgi:hypothetical protein